MKPLRPSITLSDEEAEREWSGPDAASLRTERVHQPPTELRRQAFGQRPIPPRQALVRYVPRSRMQRLRKAVGEALLLVACTASITFIALLIAGYRS